MTNSGRTHQFSNKDCVIKYYPDLLEYSRIVDGNEIKIREKIGHPVWKHRRSHGFNKLFVNMTDQCNMKCVYCYNKNKNYSPRTQKLETIKKAIDLIVAQADEEFEFSAVGGEPLLVWDTLYESIVYASSCCKKNNLKFSVSIITNGTLLNKQKIAFLSKYSARVLVSVDGDCERHNRHRKYRDGSLSFSDLAQNTQNLLESKVEVEALAILARGETDIDNVVKELCEIGFCNIGVNLISTDIIGEQYKEGDLKNLNVAYGNLTEWLVKNSNKRIKFTPFDDIASFINQGVRRSFFCHAGVESITLSTDGLFYVCPVLTGSEKAVLGDIKSGLDVRAIDCFYADAEIDHQNSCGECWANTVCGGGCVSRKKAFTGDMFQLASLECLHQKMRMEWAMTYEVLLDEKNRRTASNN